MTRTIRALLDYRRGLRWVTRASFCQQRLPLLQKSRLCLQSKDDKVLRKLFLNGFLLRDWLSGKVDFRPIVAFHLISRVPPGIDPHLLVYYERHSFLRGTDSVDSLFAQAPCRGSGHTETWEAGKRKFPEQKRNRASY